MAEALSRLSQRSTKFKNNIVFLFNGAEETALQVTFFIDFYTHTYYLDQIKYFEELMLWILDKG
jgi:hypothetical protein